MVLLTVSMVNIFCLDGLKFSWRQTGKVDFFFCSHIHFIVCVGTFVADHCLTKGIKGFFLVSLELFNRYEIVNEEIKQVSFVFPSFFGFVYITVKNSLFGKNPSELLKRSVKKSIYRPVSQKWVKKMRPNLGRIFWCFVISPMIILLMVNSLDMNFENYLVDSCWHFVDQFWQMCFTRINQKKYIIV